MPQNPIVTTLYVSQLKAGANVALTPAGGTGIVTITGQSGLSSPVPQQIYNAVSTAPTANNLNLTGANMTGATSEVWLNLTAALSAGATATLPSVASLVTAMEAAGIMPVAGANYILNLMNTSSGDDAWTVTVDSGATFSLTGTMTVAQNTYRKCLITLTSLTAATLQSLGEYAITSGI